MTRTTRSVRAMVRLLDESSPTTTCSVVMIRKASAPASPMPATLALSPSTGSSSS